MSSANQDAADSASRKTNWRNHWLHEFGSIEAIQQETPEEIAIEKALRPFERKAVYKDPRTAEVSTYVEYNGLEDEPIDYDKLPADIVAAVSAAYPVPPTLRGVLEEHTRWNDLGQARYHVCDWDLPTGVRARILVLEHLLYVRPA